VTSARRPRQSPPAAIVGGKVRGYTTLSTTGTLGRVNTDEADRPSALNRESAFMPSEAPRSPAASPPGGLPPVVPPSGKFLAQLFLVPGIIVTVAVLWLL